MERIVSGGRKIKPNNRKQTFEKDANLHKIQPVCPNSIPIHFVHVFVNVQQAENYTIGAFGFHRITNLSLSDT